jgi:hypothetical protein
MTFANGSINYPLTSRPHPKCIRTSPFRYEVARTTYISIRVKLPHCILLRVFRAYLRNRFAIPPRAISPTNKPALFSLHLPRFAVTLQNTFITYTRSFGYMIKSLHASPLPTWDLQLHLQHHLRLY